MPSKLRIVTYNIHKCRGLDRRISAARIVSVLEPLDADVICLQEVVNAPEKPAAGSPGKDPRITKTEARGVWSNDQCAEIARAFPQHKPVFGANRPLHGGTYGNLTLSRLPVASTHNHDLTSRREERGALQTDITLGPHTLHLFNVHLGTGLYERRRQARLLLGEKVLGNPSLHPPRLLVGDLNEWTRGLTTRLLLNTFQTFRPRHTLRVPATYPGVLPLFTLDHCFYEPPLELVTTRLVRTRTALVASDHLPLVADFRLP